MAKNGKNGKHHAPAKRKRRTQEEIAILVRDATRLLKAKHRKMSIAQVAELLKVDPQLIYYHVGSKRSVLAAA